MTDNLLHTKDSLQGMSKENCVLSKKHSSLKKKLDKVNGVYDATLDDLLAIEDELEDENTKLVDEITSLKERSGCADKHLVSVQTKEGKVFTPSVRHLYYSLLANQVPPAKIPTTIR